MTTPAYTDPNWNKPAGSDTPTVFSGDTLTAVRALRDMAIAGRVAGFVQSRTQGTGPDVARPQYIAWYSASLGIGFRKKITWTSYKPTTVEWEWTNDSAASWTTMGAAQVNTFDASDNITASTNSGGFVTLLHEVWAKALKAVADLAAHIAGTGTGVHGLGSMSTQSAASVAVTGGTINGTSLGATTPGNVDAKRVREDFQDYGAIANGATVTLELDKYAHFAFTPSATLADTVTIAVSGAPAAGKSQVFTLEIVNGQRSADAKITWPAAFKWIGGSATRPSDTALEAAGRNLFSFVTRDGGTRCEITHLGKGG